MTTIELNNIFANNSELFALYNAKVAAAKDAVIASGTYGGDSIEEKNKLVKAATEAKKDVQDIIDNLYIEELKKEMKGILHAYINDPYRPEVVMDYKKGKKGGYTYSLSDMSTVEGKKVRAIYPLTDLLEMLEDAETIRNTFDMARRATIGWAWKNIAEESEKERVRKTYLSQYGDEEAFTVEGRDKTEKKWLAIGDCMTKDSLKITIKTVMQFIVIDHVLDRKKNGEVVAIDRNTFINRAGHLLHQVYTGKYEVETKEDK